MLLFALYIYAGDSQGLMSVWIFDLVSSPSLLPLCAHRSETCQAVLWVKILTWKQLTQVSYGTLPLSSLLPLLLRTFKIPSILMYVIILLVSQMLIQQRACDELCVFLIPPLGGAKDRYAHILNHGLYIISGHLSPLPLMYQDEAISCSDNINVHMKIGPSHRHTKTLIQ